MGGGDAGPLLARGWDTGRGGRAAGSSERGEDAALGLAGVGSLSLWCISLFIIPLPPFFPPSPPLLSYAVGEARQPGLALPSRPPSIRPPSLHIPPFSLKTWAPGCSPLRWQHLCRPAAALYPFPHPRHHRPEPPAVPADRLCLPRWGYLDAAAGCAARPAAALAGTLQPLPAGEQLIVNFKLFLPVLPRLARGVGGCVCSSSRMRFHLQWEGDAAALGGYGGAGGVCRFGGTNCM